MKVRLAKTFVDRHPLAFSSLLTLALFGLAIASMAAIPRATISTVEDLPPGLELPPSDLERALITTVSPENLFHILGILLAVCLLTWLGWWRGAGFNRPSQWRNLRLLSFPLLVGVLPLLGGIRFSGPAFLASMLLGVLITAFSEEVLYRGVVWRALVPTGLIRAAVGTSLLSGVLRFGTSAMAGPWPEALLLTMPAICVGFMYAALRWRTASIWPVILTHFVLTFATSISTPRTIPYLVPLLTVASVLGFAGYGLFLLRNPRVRADGG